MIEKMALSVINPLLSDLKVSIEKRVFGHVRSLVESRPPNKDVLVNTFQTKVRRVLSFHPQTSRYGTHSGYSLRDTAKELTQEPEVATIANRSNV